MFVPSRWRSRSSTAEPADDDVLIPGLTGTTV
jgi:hypothetical protein